MADKDLRDTVLAGQPQVKRTDFTLSAANAAHFQNNDTMKTYLLANGYSAAQLHSMTRNDLIYALKLKLGIKS